MNVAFAGTPEFAATILRGLVESRHEVGLVISQPDTRRGRGRRVSSSPVAALARDAGLPLAQPEKINAVAPDIARHGALVVAAYGQILRPDTLYAADHGAWNVHASLLPAYRGAAPIERAIMNGEKETGISIMRMDEGLDTGPVARHKSTPVPADMTSGELTDILARLGSQAIVEVLTEIEDGDVALEEQDDHLATYAAKLTTEDLEIRWQRSAREVHDQVRALAPRPGARAHHPGFDGPVKILRSRPVEEVENVPDLDESPGSVATPGGRILVRCGEGVIEVEQLQAPGGKPLAAVEFLLGKPLEEAFLR